MPADERDEGDSPRSVLPSFFTEALFSSPRKPKSFQDFSSHRILWFSRFLVTSNLVVNV